MLEKTFSITNGKITMNTGIKLDIATNNFEFLSNQAINLAYQYKKCL